MRGPWFVRVRAFTLVVMVATTCFGTGVRADDEPKKLSGSDLDTLVGPIALYPDPILAQVLTASTFPDQVVDANKWAIAHKGLEGDALAKAMDEAQFAWDASVQALVPFPSVLETLTGDSNALKKLGDAVLVQRGDVMDAVQRMRKKAQDYGNLKSSEQLTVTTEDKEYIVIQPANPEVIYVPVYQPAVVYAPPPPTGAVLFGFVAGVAVASMWSNNWYGGCGFYWHSSTVVIHNGAWGRTYSNRYNYHPPYGGGGPVYVNHNTNININNSRTNVNTGNINTGDINRNNVNSGNVNNAKVNSDRAAVGGGGKGTASASQQPAARPATSATQRPTTTPGSSARGYTQSPSSGSRANSAYSGSQNGRSESVASSRGHASYGGGGGAARGGGGGGGRRR